MGVRVKANVKILDKYITLIRRDEQTPTYMINLFFSDAIYLMFKDVINILQISNVYTIYFSKWVRILNEI